MFRRLSTGAVIEDIVHQLAMKDPALFRGSFFRPNTAQIPNLVDVVMRALALTGGVLALHETLLDLLRGLLEQHNFALAGFLHLATQEGPDAGTPPQAAVDAAYALGRGEALFVPPFRARLLLRSAEGWERVGPRVQSTRSSDTQAA